MSKTTTITKLEKQLLIDLAHTDHSSDGHGFSMWVACGYESMPMKQARALISTLVQKGVIAYTAPNTNHKMYNEYGHICPRDEFVECDHDKFGNDSKYDPHTKTWVSNPFVDGVHGYRYKNLKVI